MDLLASVLEAIDRVNACDPNTEETADGAKPAELVYGQRMSQVLRDFAPQASDTLTIAVRGQHIERWTRPRSNYPEGRQGYLAWRHDAARFHAGRVSALMREAGYDENTCERTANLILKKNLKRDDDAQTLEDVACLVFFRWYAGAFSQKHDIDTVLPIVSKTARKMSAKGRAAALAMALPPAVAEAIAAI